MRRILLFSLLFFIFIPSIKASSQTASEYILMDMESGRVLEGKDYNNPKLIASITKIMTCLLAIESNRLDETVVVDESILKAYGSGIYIQVGEELTLRDLLYGLMLRSGNDAAVMVASFVSGSEKEFVKKMNAKAKEIGMKNTTFSNSSGLDEEDNGNLSTAYDMAILTKYAMQYEEYRNIVKTKKYTLKTNYKAYIWHNKNKILNYDYITGGKTGFTEKAGRTLVSTADINNLKLIAVTIRDSDDWNTHTSLYNEAKDKYSLYKVLDKKDFKVKDDYYKGKLYIEKDFYMALTEDETKKVNTKIKLEKKKDYKTKDKVGKCEIYIDNTYINSVDIYIQKEKTIKEKKNVFQKIWELIKFW